MFWFDRKVRSTETSLLIGIPTPIANNMGVKRGDTVRITAFDGGFVVTNAKQTRTLEGLLGDAYKMSNGD